MTAINFPSSPSNGDTHTVGGVTYTYNSAETKWKTTINSNAFLPLTGGTVSSDLTLQGNLHVDTTGAIELPTGTTDQRPTGVNGMLRYNTTKNVTEEYRNGNWHTLSNVIVATGGNVSTVGSYTVHTFTTSGTFTVVSGSVSVEYLVIAGGGGGSQSSWATGGGAGGAGGYRCSVSGENSGGGASAESALTLNAGDYTVTVGAGGADRTNGSNSVFGTITSIGGGRGGYFSPNTNGANGGSGGGASYQVGPGSGTTGQGYAGGSSNSNHYQGAGGGGAGGAGSPTPSANSAGNGGPGVSSSITGTSVARAGGGGGGWVNHYSGGSAGTATAGGGAGGSGGQSAGSAGNGSNGTANTGGGGGGPVGNGGSSVGGTGGSGVVIVRYLTP